MGNGGDEIYTMSATTSKDVSSPNGRHRGASLPCLAPENCMRSSLERTLQRMGQAVDVVFMESPWLRLLAPTDEVRPARDHVGPVANFTVIDQHPVDLHASIHTGTRLVRRQVAQTDPAG